MVSNGTGSITFLAKYIDCDIYADSKQITVGGSAIHLPVHDTTLCQGVSAIITAPNGYKSYSWNNGLSQNQSITISQPGVYYVSATPYCGIVSTDSIWVHFDSTQLAITSANVAVCLGDTASILLANGSLFYNIGWQPSQYTSFENNYLKCWPAQQTQYTVSATDSHNCNISTGFEVTILPDPIVEGLKDTYQKCDGDTIHITASANTFSRYLWSSGSTNNGITIKDTGTYWVSVTDTNNCGTKKYFNVKQAICQQAIYFPNAFTPNNDGRNDGFGATAYGILQQYNLTVWNRYGQKVFATTDISTKWNGMLKGQPLPIGTYIWECRYNFPNKPVQVQKGTVVMLK